MKESTLQFLCNPTTKEDLRLEITESGEEVLVSVDSGQRFPIKNGIPVFIHADQVVGLNKKYQGIYDRLARSYDFFEKIVSDLALGGRDNARRDLVRGIALHPGDKFLEVSIGTGINLRYLPAGAVFYGLDISAGMLAQCQRNLEKWRLQAELFQGMAEQLPFRDGIFDVVFHVGGFNFFENKEQALQEMIRVAKGGAKIIISDETEEVAKTWGKSRLPFARAFFANRKEEITAPIHLVPSTVLDVRVEQRLKGKLYLLSFVKPPIT
ncbi:MAG: methyltransferase domain-containing protein [Bellilinea sp.]|jgi:ubiquinone/menaquinone biosynthesis C-methylase UbiE/uncharacterized protein YbaR (Trm112 family)